MTVYATAPSQGDSPWDLLQCNPVFETPGLYCPQDDKPSPDDVEAWGRVITHYATVVMPGPRPLWVGL
jgi:hypothetical protein